MNYRQEDENEENPYDIGAIRTNYSDEIFRSRLEARWAVFFDELHSSYNYEPEFEQEVEIYYIPDFYLDYPGCFIEIKPDRALLMREVEKGEKLALLHKEPVFILKGLPTYGYLLKG